MRAAETRPTLAAIARPSGGFAMVAMDQRESLRTMFAEAGGRRPDDAQVLAFKLDVARVLAPYASGFLIDRHHGFHQVRDAGMLPPTCGLVLAADALTQQEGAAVEETDLDEVVVDADFDLSGVSALKLLLIWRRDAHRAQRVSLAERFIAAARDRGVLSVLEPVVRATPEERVAGSWDTDVAIREAAAELSPLGADLYKVQVPRFGTGTDEELEVACKELSGAITGPWVVLSQGVHPDHFARAVTAACRAGASGFLAGRALWSDVVGENDVAGGLRARAVPRLERLCAIVDAHARPWDAR